MKVSDIFEGTVVPFDPQRIKAKKYLDELLKTKIYGTFAQDHELWDKLEHFIINKNNPMEYRIQALRKLHRITGQLQKSYSASDVNKYISDLDYDTKELQR